jgi:hypothetical protein
MTEPTDRTEDVKAHVADDFRSLELVYAEARPLEFAEVAERPAIAEILRESLDP